MNSLMKKAWVFLFFLILAGTSFAADPQNRSIFIEGTAVSAEQQMFFMDNFRMEAIALGYTVTDFEWDAGYTFSFDVIPNEPSDDFLYTIQITFFRNEDFAELVSFGFLFTDLEEMYEYNQLLFFRAAVNIPPIVLPDGDTWPYAGETYQQSEPIIIYQTDSSADQNRPVQMVRVPQSEEWRNKWLYLRFSFDFPITFYALQGEGLLNGKSVHDGKDPPEQFSPLDNRVVAMPGGTLGVEVQLLNWLSIEPKFQLGMENLNNENFITMSAGAELKFPLKFSSIMLEPYGAVSYPLVYSKDIFDSYPGIGFGGGIQLAIRGGNSGAIFLDLNYMYYTGDAVIKNHLGDPFSEPQLIHYKRSAIGLGIGYKLGLIDRK